MTQVLPLSCDWLALSLDLKTVVSGCPTGHRWFYYSPTNVWQSRWCLYNDYGDKIFTLLFQLSFDHTQGRQFVIGVLFCGCD